MLGMTCVMRACRLLAGDHHMLSLMANMVDGMPRQDTRWVQIPLNSFMPPTGLMEAGTLVYP